MEHGVHILVPTAFGPSSRAARELALAIARRSEGLVTLMHVAASSAEPRSATTGMDALGNLHAALWLSRAEASHTPIYHRAPAPDAAPDHLEAFRAEVPRECCESLDLRTVWRVGKVVEQIVDFVNEAGVDMIVLGTARQGNLPWSRGVRRELMVRTPCKVVVVRRPPLYRQLNLREWLLGASRLATAWKARTMASPPEASESTEASIASGYELR